MGTERSRPRAAGVLIEFDQGRPIIVDRSLYRELVKGAVKRTADELDAKAAATAKEKQTQRAGKAPADPLTVAKRERDAQLRELADQAHGANLDLGVALLSNLAAVDPNSMAVARFFVYSLLGSDYDNSPYTQAGERIQQLAMGGIRLIVDELRTDVTKTRKDGTRGRLKIDYGHPREPEQAIKWLWKFVDAAKTPGELYGRALVVIAAEQYALRLVPCAASSASVALVCSDTASRAPASKTRQVVRSSGMTCTSLMGSSPSGARCYSPALTSAAARGQAAMPARCSSRCALSGHPSLCSLEARSCSFEQVPQYRAAPCSWGQHNSRDARLAHSWRSWASTSCAQP